MSESYGVLSFLNCLHSGSQSCSFYWFFFLVFVPHEINWVLQVNKIVHKHDTYLAMLRAGANWKRRKGAWLLCGLKTGEFWDLSYPGGHGWAFSSRWGEGKGCHTIGKLPFLNRPRISQKTVILDLCFPHHLALRIIPWWCSDCKYAWYLDKERLRR